MRKILVIVFTVIIMTQLSANAFDWGSFLRWFFDGTETTQTTVSNSDLTKTLTEIQDKSRTTDTLAQDTFMNVVSMLSTKNEAEKIKKEIDELNTGKYTDSEKSLKFLGIIENYASALNNNKVSTILTIKNLSDTDKTALSSSLQNLAGYGAEYSLLSKTGTKTASKVLSALDDEQVKLLNSINALSTELNKKANTLTTFANQLQAFSKLAGLKLN